MPSATTNLQTDLLSELRNKRVGLVLAGGGFKGSYQIGVWLALRALGIRKLHAIAGTSVGALNAVLIANDDPKQAKRIWRETSIVRWSPHGIRILATACSLLFGPILFAYLSLLFYAVFVLTQSQTWASRCLTLTAIFSGTVAMSRRTTKTFLRGDNSDGSAIVSFLPVCCFYLINVATGAVSWWWMVVGLAIGMICQQAANSILHSEEKVKIRLFSNADLLKQLLGHLNNLDRMRRNAQHLFVTISRSYMVSDPLRLTRRFKGPFMNFGRPQPRTYRLRPGWIAEYRDLLTMETANKALDTLKLTSALPYIFPTGFVPRRLPPGVVYATTNWLVDGGLVDNNPILPVLLGGVVDGKVTTKNFASVDYVILVQLNNNGFRSFRTRAQIEDYVMRTYVSSLRECDRMDLFLKRYNDVSDHVGELTPADVLPAEMRLRDVGFIVIGPAKPLASINLPILRFLTGTLNLSFATRRRWLAWGFHETFRRMRRVGMADPKGIVFIPPETQEPL